MTAIEERIVAPGHGSLSPSLFAVHSTANPGATAANHASLWSREPDYAVHLVSDWTQALHTVPYGALCWQVGNGNAACEGLEICEATNEDDFMAGIEIAASVVRQRLAAHGWGVDSVRSHKWFTENYGGSDHTDPIPYFDRFGYSWEEFLADVAKEENASAEAEDTEEDMNCIYQPNGQSYLVWFDGNTCHPLAHPDEVTAINMVHKQCTGRDIPVFALGQETAPWANRFEAAVNRK